MASKRGKRRRSCDGKVAYAKAEAIATATKMRRETGDSLDGYPCEFGSHWHVGHRPKHVQAAITHRRKT